MSVAVHKRNVREALAPRREPYWAAPLEPGRFLGFRRVNDDDGSWIARARNPDTGKQEYRALGKPMKLADIATKFDYDAASKAAREWFGSLDAGVVTKGPFTVEMACKEYVEDRRREKSKECSDDAEWRFKKSVYDTAFGRIEVAKLRTPALKKWREGLGITKAGANRMMTTLRAALNLAVEHNRVPATAAQAWRAVKQYPKADGRREIFLDLHQRRALLEAATGTVRDLIEAALLTGARPGELATAKRGAFDKRTKTLKLTGKTGPRDVPLTAPALALFERLAKSTLPSEFLFPHDDDDDDDDEDGANTDADATDDKPLMRMKWSRGIRAAADTAVIRTPAAILSKMQTATK